MATAADIQGIRGLPPQGEQAAPQLSIDDSYDAIRGGLSDASPQASAQVQETLNQLLPALDQVSDEDLDKLIQVVQYMHDHENEYSSIVSELVNAGIVQAGVFPEEYDPEVIATLGMVLLEAKRQRMQSAPQQMPQPPMQLAKGGIAEAARMVASHGRYGDTMLAHINKDEAKLLKKRGGSGTINPKTGLPEFFGFGDLNPVRIVTGQSELTGGGGGGGGGGGILGGILGGIGKAVSGAVGSVVNGVKQVVSSPVGRILATAALAAFLGPAAMSVYGVAGAGLGTAASIGLASGAVTALGGGNVKDILRSGAQGYFIGAVTGPAGSAIGSATGVTNAAAQAAMGAGAAGTAAGVISGKNLQQSLKEGLTSAAIAGLTTGASKGFDTAAPGQTPIPGQPTPQGPLTAEQVNQQISGMASNQTGNVSGQYNPATGRFEVPVADAVARTPVQIAAEAPIQPRGSEVLNNYVAANAPLAPPAGAPPLNIGDVEAQAGGMYGPTVPPPQTSMWDQAKDIYKNNLSPSGIRMQGTIDAIASGNEAQAAYLKQYPNASASDLAAVKNAATQANMPGTFSTYGPMVGAGLGIAALSGGFKAKTVAPSPAAQNIMSGQATYDLINANPRNYITQNLPGVTYDPSGNITGSSRWTPRSGYGATEVAGDYIPYSPSKYQPYNFMPRYAADGGYMQTSPAFPGTPLTSPMQPHEPSGMLPMNTSGMPMNTSGMPMNTSGIPMNLPMGYAGGGMPTTGIASLAPGGYPRRTGQISGPGTETSDSIPAMLSDGEFVMTAKAVKALGKGNRRAGAKKMYALMHHLEKNAARG